MGRWGRYIGKYMGTLCRVGTVRRQIGTRDGREGRDELDRWGRGMKRWKEGEGNSCSWDGSWRVEWNGGSKGVVVLEVE